MKVRAKFGFSVADAQRLCQEADKVGIFVGDSENRYYFLLPVAAITGSLSLGFGPVLCHLDVDARVLTFGGAEARYHAERVKARLRS